MARLLVIAATASVAVAVGVLSGFDRGPDRGHHGGDGFPARTTQVVAQDAAKLPWLKPGTRKVVGEFEVRGGKLRLETAETTEGEACLLDVDVATGVSGSTCSDGGLFASRKVAFSLNFDGGPERFRSLDVVGVAAPAVGSVAVVMTDGTVVDAQLTRDRAFVVESSAAELERDVLPASLRIYGRSGRLVESVEIPALR